MSAYYNEHDPKAAATLRELIKQGHIAAGDVDERSIEDVSPAELMGYTQRHFFAGYGVWSYALRLAGWADDRSVVTGSCPCQPFSAAGKGEGFADERHLWPAFYWHIGLGRPDPVFGEQVAAKDGLAWLDVVSADLEVADYAVGTSDLCAAGVGAPHIRQRLYWMAYSQGIRSGAGLCDRQPDRFVGHELTNGCGNGQLGDAESRGCRECRDAPLQGRGGYPDSPGGSPSGMAYTHGRHPGTEGLQRGGEHGLLEEDGGAMRLDGTPRPLADAGNGQLSQPRGGSKGRDGSGPAGAVYDGRTGSGPTNGFWRAADWLLCRDRKWRPVEPGTSPLAHGAAARMGRLRGYGNAINAEVAATFIRAGIKALEEAGIA